MREIGVGDLIKLKPRKKCCDSWYVVTRKIAPLCGDGVYHLVTNVDIDCRRVYVLGYDGGDIVDITWIEDVIPSKEVVL